MGPISASARTCSASSDLASAVTVLIPLHWRAASTALGQLLACTGTDANCYGTSGSESGRDWPS